MGGVSTTALIGAINAGASAADQGEISLWAAGFFVIALLLFIQTQHYILITTTAEIGAIIHKLRVRLMDYVRRSELLPLEMIGRAEIVSAITGDTAILTQASNMLAFAVQGALLITLVTTYVAYLSFVGFRAERRHRRHRRGDLPLQDQAACRRNARSGAMGKPAVRSPERRARRLQRSPAQPRAQRRAVRSRRRGLKDRRQHQDPHPERNLPPDGAAADLALHPARFGRIRRATVQHRAPGSITKAVTALVFIVGACSGLVQSIPIIAAANAAADRLAQLEVKLAGITSLSDEITAEPAKKFTKIEMRDVEFHYPGKTADAPFRVGPFNFTLELRRSRHPDRRQRLGQIDLHEDPGRLLPAGVGRDAARRRACRRRPLRTLPQSDHRDLS